MRLLDGPNLYFPRPAAKVTLDCSGLVDLPVGAARLVADALGLGSTRPGPPGSVFRQRFAIRLLIRVVRRLARSGGVARLAVRCRTGSVGHRDRGGLPVAQLGAGRGAGVRAGPVVDDLLGGSKPMLAALAEAGPRWPPRRPARRRG